MNTENITSLSIVRFHSVGDIDVGDCRRYAISSETGENSENPLSGLSILRERKAASKAVTKPGKRGRYDHSGGNVADFTLYEFSTRITYCTILTINVIIKHPITSKIIKLPTTALRSPLARPSDNSHVSLFPDGNIWLAAEKKLVFAEKSAAAH